MWSAPMLRCSLVGVLVFSRASALYNNSLDQSLHHQSAQSRNAITAIGEEPKDDLSTPTAVLSSISAVLKTLQSTWYELWLGTWPSSIDWTGAVTNTHLISTLNLMSAARTDEAFTSQALSEDDVNKYFAHTAAYYFGENASALRKEAYDDMLWVILSWLESVKFVKAHAQRHHSGDWYGQQHIDVFAHRARVFYTLASAGWSDDLCGGGMTWNPDLLPYKNAVTNQLFIAASIGMYMHFPGDENDSPYITSQYKLRDRRFLDGALEGYAWLKKTNMTNRQGLYVDGYHISGYNGSSSGNKKCDDRNEMVYTYNQGIILSALREMYTVTGNHSFLEDGYKLVNSTIAATGWNMTTDFPTNTSAWQGLGRNGIMEEFCDSTGRCSQDAQTFKSIFFHHLAAFCHLSHSVDNLADLPHHTPSGEHWIACTSYTKWVKHNADAALSTRDADGHIGSWWGQLNERPDGLKIMLNMTLPAGAIDYRGDPRQLSRLRRGLRHPRTDPASEHHQAAKDHAVNMQELLKVAQAEIADDVNDQGRGRTVESHIGGLAVLNCLWHLQQLGT